MNEVQTFEQTEPSDLAELGGKGLALGLMLLAGLPVPPGFCVTSAAYRRLRGRSPASDPDLAGTIGAAYRRLGGFVAVRSSATAEDGALTSFAGQQETVLGVMGETAVLDAVARCWASLQSERAMAYRRQQGVVERDPAMAVVVQRLVPAEVAGVLFTRDPLDSKGQSLVIEASWGLGESVVSGRVTPDRFRLHRETLAIQERIISAKRLCVTPEGVRDVPVERQQQPSLTDQQLTELAELGRRLEAFYGEARDVEWAWAEGQFWLLQARPITTASAAEREQVRREEVAALAARARPEGTVWSRYNLAESLREPTPMSWALARLLTSAQGGDVLVLRDLGLRPDPALGEDSIYDLVCGRVYCNLDREPYPYANGLPYEHSFADLKATPQLALDEPQPKLNWSGASWRSLLALPATMWRMARFTARLQQMQPELAQRLRTEVFPKFAQETDASAEQNLASLDNAGLCALFRYWIRHTLCDFARASLQPTVLVRFLREQLKQVLAKYVGPERSQVVLSELIMGVRPDAEADWAGAYGELVAGRLERMAFLKRFGHRGRQEMELAEPRWAEDSTALDRFASQHEAGNPAPPADMAALCARIAGDAKLTTPQQAALEEQVRLLRDYLGLRETAKHYLMKGYALLRRVLLELDRRHHLGGGVFYLQPGELDDLAKGRDFSALIAQRKRRRQLALSLEVPPVLFSDDLEAIGRPISYPDATTFQGVSLSMGAAEGTALVVHRPGEREIPAEPYVLVCPSTDPDWVPWFERAVALVMEIGGMLSHGAIVAREYGLPAVGSLPDIQHRLQSGQRLRVDGTAGTLTLLPTE
jgi:pyruvate,water dikinase